MQTSQKKKSNAKTMGTDTWGMYMLVFMYMFHFFSLYIFHIFYNE